jgi:flagellar basal body-associated protein FliL
MCGGGPLPLPESELVMTIAIVVIVVVILGIAVMVITVRLSGRPAKSRRLQEIQREAAAEVAIVREEDESFRSDGPGQQEDDL